LTGALTLAFAVAESASRGRGDRRREIFVGGNAVGTEDEALEIATEAGDAVGVVSLVAVHGDQGEEQEAGLDVQMMRSGRMDSRPTGGRRRR
jgi:hypothetical protein